MNLHSLTSARLLWTLAAVLATIVVVASGEADSSLKLAAGKDQRAGKYLEVEDLNSAQPNYAVNTGLVRDVKLDDDRLVKRATNSTKRPTRQQVKKPRPGFFWTLASVTYEVRWELRGEDWDGGDC